MRTISSSPSFSVLAATERPPLVADEAGILAILLAVLAAIFWTAQHPVLGKIFKIIPALVFCYFVPTTLTTLGVIPGASPLYDWIKEYVLPASLLLLILALDVPGILRLGPRAGIMLLAGTAGVVIGGPVALLIGRTFVDPEILDELWRGMAALSGSWIGGGANMVALKDMSECPDGMFTKMIIVDVFVANIWMGILLYLAGHQERIDRWTGANTAAIEDLKRRVANFEARVMRIPTLTDLMLIVAFGFVGSWLAHLAGAKFGEWIVFFSGTIWKFILITTVGVALSFTPVRRLDGAGASKIGSVLLYILVASIGAHADFRAIGDAPELILIGLIWMSCHVLILLGVARLINAPIFFVAVGSQANIGGAASAPIVASAFHPTLAPVGVLLAVCGYVLGTYAGLGCMYLMRWIAML